MRKKQSIWAGIRKDLPNYGLLAPAVIYTLIFGYLTYPYIVIALSNLGCLSAGSYFEDVSNLTYKLHKAYWDYKVSSCINK